MPSRIQELLIGKNEQIDYGVLIKKHPWIVEKDHVCILGPDSDGLLCGLFMSHYLGWRIAGFYDGKICVAEKTLIEKKPVFLDMEIFRKEIRSMGHHMVLYNKKQIPKQWANFENCIQPNILRNYDGNNDFRLKYPLGTVHLLLGIIGYHLRTLKIPDSAIPPLFFTDGVFNVLFKYPENVLNWLNFLRINEDWHPLKTIFENDKYTVFTLMQAMDEFFRKRDKISIPKERGDRLKISNTDGSPANILESNQRSCQVNPDAKRRAVEFIKVLSDSTKWSYKDANWVCWENMKIYKFIKSDFQGDKQTITNKSFQELIDKNPLSWAMTSGTNIEYTLEEPDKLTKYANFLDDL